MIRNAGESTADMSAVECTPNCPWHQAGDSLASVVEAFVEHDGKPMPDGPAYAKWCEEWDRRLKRMRAAVRQYRTTI